MFVITLCLLYELQRHISTALWWQQKPFDIDLCYNVEVHKHTIKNYWTKFVVSSQDI